MYVRSLRPKFGSLTVEGKNSRIVLWILFEQSIDAILLYVSSIWPNSQILELCPGLFGRGELQNMFLWRWNTSFGPNFTVDKANERARDRESWNRTYLENCRHNKKKEIWPSGGSIQFQAQEPTSNHVSKSSGSGIWVVTKKWLNQWTVGRWKQSGAEAKAAVTAVTIPTWYGTRNNDMPCLWNASISSNLASAWT